VTTITGIIRDSGNALLSGALDVRLDAYMLDRSTTPDSILTTQPKTFAIVNGAINISLPESETQNQTYYFEFFSEATQVSYFFPEGGQYTGPVHQWTDLKWYVGDVHEANSKVLFRATPTIRTKVFDRRVVIPNVASVEFSDLLPTGVTTDVLDTSIRRLAQLLTGDVQYAQALRGGPDPKGPWNTTTYYQKDDFVTYAGSSWLCIATAPIVSSTPNDANPNWLCIAKKGDAGGTGGQATAYSASGWLNQLWAPSAGVLRNVIEGLAKLTDIANLASIASPAFTGNPSRTTSPLASDRSQQIPTTSWVGGLFATIDSPAFTSNPSAPTQAVTDVSGKLATTKFVDDYSRARTWGTIVYAQQNSAFSFPASIYTMIPFTTELVDSANLFLNGIFTPAATGLYDISYGGGMTVPSGAVGLYAVALHQGSSLIGILFLDVTTSGTVWQSGTVRLNLVAGTPYNLRIYVSGSNPSIPTGTPPNWISIDRVSLL
jgi:hypothetical protein